jgi:hypothetical protein
MCGSVENFNEKEVIKYLLINTKRERDIYILFFYKLSYEK